MSKAKKPAVIFIGLRICGRLMHHYGHRPLEVNESFKLKKKEIRKMTMQ